MQAGKGGREGGRREGKEAVREIWGIKRLQPAHLALNLGVDTLLQLGPDLAHELGLDGGICRVHSPVLASLLSKDCVDSVRLPREVPAAGRWVVAARR